MNAGDLKLALAQIVAAMRLMSTAIAAAAKTEVVEPSVVEPRHSATWQMGYRILDTLRDIRTATNHAVYGFIYISPDDAKAFHALTNPGDLAPAYDPKPGDTASLFGELAMVDGDLMPGVIYIGVKVPGV